jgi:hypothetical protein
MRRWWRACVRALTGGLCTQVITTLFEMVGPRVMTEMEALQLCVFYLLAGCQGRRADGAMLLPLCTLIASTCLAHAPPMLYGGSRTQAC